VRRIEHEQTVSAAEGLSIRQHHVEAALDEENSFVLPGLLHLSAYWLFWPSLLLALSFAWG